MKALLISPEEKTITPVTITGRDDITGLIGYDTLESEALGDNGDRLFFDEECFLRGAAGRFQVDSLIPISGKALVVGTDGDETRLRDVQLDIGELRERLRYL